MRSGMSRNSGPSPSRKKKLDRLPVWERPYEEGIRRERVMRVVALRQDREGAAREAEAVVGFGPGHDDQCAGRRHLIEISHHLDLPMAVLEQPAFGIEIRG